MTLNTSMHHNPMARLMPTPISQPARYCGMPGPTELQSPAQDRVDIRFGAKTVLNQPNSISASRFQNDRVSLAANDLVPCLVEKLDEIMTVTGEFYSKNEAFTTLIDVKVPTLTAQKYGRIKTAESVDAKLGAQVEHTLNVGKQANIGIMVMSSDATARESGDYLGQARASFNAIDPQSVKEGALKPVAVTLLTVGEADTSVNTKASAWNQQMSGFYKNVAARVGAKDNNVTVPSLAGGTSPTRLVNTNVYVTSQMLNKKKTGHGGVAVGMALKDMNSLLKGYTKLPQFIKEVTASYQDKFVESDALQFDTTLDHLDPQTGDMVLSSRIYKLDTKAQTVQGPVILVHARANANDILTLKEGWGQAMPTFDATTLDEEGRKRQQEAVSWLALRN